MFGAFAGGVAACATGGSVVGGIFFGAATGFTGGLAGIYAGAARAGFAGVSVGIGTTGAIMNQSPG